MTDSASPLGVDLTIGTFLAPDNVSPESAWVEHIPFAFWLVEALRPRTIVELGTHVGTSYFSLCQAVSVSQSLTQCFAVDTWQGDEHAMFYGEEVFEAVSRHNARFAEFSTLLRSTFDDARAQFEPGTIDLLHIDGLHTYEAVKHDFETWFDALSDRAVVLFHDTAERERDFGVYRFWEEVAPRYPHFEFLHGHGLGVLGVGSNLPAPVRDLFASMGEGASRQTVRTLFSRLGDGISANLRTLAEEGRTQEVRDELTELTRHYEAASKETTLLRVELCGLAETEAALRRELGDMREVSAAALQRAAAANNEAAALADALNSARANAAADTSRLIGQIHVLLAKSNSPRWLVRQALVTAKARLKSFSARLPLVGARWVASEAVRAELMKSGLFDSNWYVAQYPDVASSGVDPLTHYLRRGAYEGRDPNSLFASAWYLQRYPDVGAARINPLLHYLRAGSKELRDPHPDFSTAGYLAANPDVLESGQNPLAHSLASVRKGRRAASTSGDRDAENGPAFLCVKRTRSLGDAWLWIGADGDVRADSTRLASKIDVIVPVYRGVSETRRCIESALTTRKLNEAFGRLIVIDDCGPEPEMRAYLDELAARADIVMLRNVQNRGFVYSVNRAMREARESDVVLLNSDAEVHGDWLDRMMRHAAADPQIATITPFSNNATICSFPEIGNNGELTEGADLATIDRAFARANAGRRVDIPTGVGFCMYIRRACLNRLGPFDEAAFGRGYGEENDFCLKALAGGWRNVLAGDVFVYHKGEVSFAGSASDAKDRAAAVIANRYPGYEAAVTAWVGQDPAFPLRFAAQAELVSVRATSVYLHVLHSFGGGTERHVAELARSRASDTEHLILLQRKQGEVLALSLLTPSTGEGWNKTEFVVDRLTAAATLIKAFGVTRVYVHHCIDIVEDFPGFLRRVGAPYDLTVHDYALVCPRTFMVRQGRYCGEPDEGGCLDCLAEEPITDSGDIIWWRLKGSGLLRGANSVLCPSADVATRIKRYVPDAAVAFEPHEGDSYRAPLDLRAPVHNPGRKLCVSALGILAEHKGGAFLLDCVEYAVAIGADIQWIVIGDFASPFATRADRLGGVLSRTGSYSEGQAVKLLNAFDPDLVLFPQRCPETYSYTLSEAFAARRAVLAPRLGSFPERIAGNTACWLYEADATPGEVVDMILRISAGRSQDVEVAN